MIFKRLFDFMVALMALVVLSPLFMVICLIILLDAGVPVFFLQQRVGRYSTKFNIFKFRTMKPDSELSGQLTVGNRDNRITRSGFWLRKYKLDELPQLINVIKGDMSLVGPRPEVPKYVALYDKDQIKVLNVRPGITDNASLEFIDENEILSRSEDPERTYIDDVMPQKLVINLKYIDHHNMMTDIRILWRTCMKIIRR